MRVRGVKPPEPGKAIRVTVEGATVAVFNAGGQLYGVDPRCTHVGGPVDQGPLAGTIVTCPWHGSQFDLRTGAVIRGPAAKPLKSYRVQPETDGLEITPG